MRYNCGSLGATRVSKSGTCICSMCSVCTPKHQVPRTLESLALLGDILAPKESSRKLPQTSFRARISPGWRMHISLERPRELFQREFPYRSSHESLHFPSNLQLQSSHKLHQLQPSCSYPFHSSPALPRETQVSLKVFASTSDGTSSLSNRPSIPTSFRGTVWKQMCCQHCD